MAGTIYNWGNYIALTGRGRMVALPRGLYRLFDDGTLQRYDDVPGLQGFWSTIGNGFHAIGSWAGNHFAAIATAGTAIYAIHSNVPIPGQQLPSAAQQQAAANAANAPAVQSSILDSLLPYLPLAAIALGAYLLFRPQPAK